MGKTFDQITEPMQKFIDKQQMFFVATAPLAGDGHVNMSPKGLDSFRILGGNRVAYLDLTGSGNETSAHIAENGRITFMFVAFTGSPNIVRLYGTGRTVLKDSPEWESLISHFPTPHFSARQIIVTDIHRTSTACGYSVPLYDYRGDRETLTKHWEAKGEDAVSAYHREKNSQSIDGLETPIGCSFVDDD